MNTDRELLELAARACGYEITGWSNRNQTTVAVLSDGSYWQPLLKNSITDTDGDALRLAVKLSITITPGDVMCTASAPRAETHQAELVNGDVYSATRRAIVRAAAAIGESK